MNDTKKGICLSLYGRIPTQGAKALEAWKAAGCDKVGLPAMGVMAGNLFRSALGFARSGFKLAPRSVRRERLAICQACDKYDPIQARCTVCGCKNKAKVWVAADSCPLPEPKWTAYQEPKS